MRAIITFHSIDPSGSVISFPPEAFARLVAGLARAALPVFDLDTLLSPGVARGVALTFDDGMASVCTHALPVLREHGAPAHLFLTTDPVGGDNRWPGQPASIPAFDMLSWDQVLACHAGGIRIEAHTASHADLPTLGDAEMEDQCARADEAITRRVGRAPRYFAYPYGRADARARALARRRYRASVTTEMRWLAAEEDAAALPRLDAHYLRPPWVCRDLASPLSRAYLASRAVARRVRGAYQ